MQRQRRRDTKPEMMLRSELHRRGLRYRVHRRPLPELNREADLIFPGQKIAVFCDGCMWHGHAHAAPPGGPNSDWWKQKIARNVHRDRDTNLRLEAKGWRV